MMLVSLSSYCQYPTIKKIGNDSVVIMTLKQGQEINKKFSTLSDSITFLNKGLFQKDTQINLLNTNNINLNNNLLIVSEKLKIYDVEVKRLNSLLVNKEKEHWHEKMKWGGWMFFSFCLTVVLASLK